MTYEKGNFLFYTQRCWNSEVTAPAQGHIIKQQKWHLKDDLSKSKEFYHTIDCQISLPKRMHILRKISHRTSVFKVDKRDFWFSMHFLRVVLVLQKNRPESTVLPLPAPIYTIFLTIVCSIVDNLVWCILLQLMN